MTKTNIAIIAGGYSDENIISRLSAETIMEHIDRSLFNPILLLWERAYSPLRNNIRAIIGGKEEKVDLNDFSIALPEGKLTFCYAFITVHGTPGEDGLLQGYLDMIGIPYNTGGVLCEALTFDKEMCKRFLAPYGAKVPKSITICHDTPLDEEAILAQISLPLFVKPNKGGSSLATTRVIHSEQLKNAIDKTLEVCDEALLEELIEGTEVTCGCVVLHHRLIQLPITEVVIKSREFFDFEAKYHGASEEITPARIAPTIAEEIQRITSIIARKINARGIIRADYIINKQGEPILLEVNTTPGMTSKSFIPQQIHAAGLSLGDILTEIIKDCIPL